MEDAGHSDTTSERRPGTMSERWRERVRMEISREAARLFWEHGVDGTTGEQIAIWPQELVTRLLPDAPAAGSGRLSPGDSRRELLDR